MAPTDYSCVTKAEAFTIHIMYSYHYALGPACQGSASLYAPPLNYKREGTQRYKGQVLHTDSQAHTLNHILNTTYTQWR
jgi:hypothetical protein